MAIFLIQTINSQVKYDFSFNLVEAVRYAEWWSGEDCQHAIIFNAEPVMPGCIPVGSVEFVLEYMKNFENVNPNTIKPTNVPKELFISKYLKRACWYSKKEKLKIEKPIFVKSADKYKLFADIVSSIDEVPNGNLFCSQKVKIDSEWRAFIYNKRLVGLNNYGGDFATFPDILLIKEMINAYEKCPNAYTLDVGINETGTFIIEVHPFVSCGLYGFAELKILPAMFIQGYKYFLESAANKKLEV